MDANRVLLSGRFMEEPMVSHEVYSEAFFLTYMEVPRLSGAMDHLPIMLPGRLLPLVRVGQAACVEGQLRSYRRSSGSVRLQLVAYARYIGRPMEEGTNQVELCGRLLRPPVVRRTPLGREIADLLLSVERNHNKKDSIPCIAWGRHAHLCADLPEGEFMHLMGRFQNREYQKELPDGHSENRMTYEVSVGSIYEGE